MIFFHGTTKENWEAIQKEGVLITIRSSYLKTWRQTRKTLNNIKLKHIFKKKERNMANNSSSSSSTGGIGFVGLLTIVFITLKLIGIIDWSWWWVLSPIWIGVSLVLVLFLVIMMVWAWASSKR